MTDSAELTAWSALLLVHADEAKEAHDRATSKDGQVFYYGRDDGDDGDESERS